MESRPGSTTAAAAAASSSSSSHINHYQHPHDAAIFNNAPIHLTRGRQARDPQAKTVSYNVASLHDFDSSLRDYLNNPQGDPEHTECQLSFWIGSTFLVPVPVHHRASQPHQPQQPTHQQPAPIQYDASQPYPDVADSSLALSLSGLHTHHPASASSNANANASTQGPGNDNSNSNGNNNKEKRDEQPRISMSIVEALQPTADPKEKMRKQRAIAKCCVDAIQKADGYRYSFHNCWNSREDDAFRFSYYCNDSLLNKDRAANGKGAKLGKRATKPVFDCKGVLSVKFSASKQTLDVFYKHIPLHKTYEERAPAPRKDSKRRKFLEENDPETLERLQSRSKHLRSDSDPQVPPRARKRTKSEDYRQPTTLESDLRAQSLVSLLELIRPEPTQPEPPPPPAPMQQPAAPAPRPVQQPQAQPSPQQQQLPVPPPPAFRVKRPRNSCDVCKAKKTKCDGTRPVCKTCIEKKRQCFYNEADESNASAAGGEPARPNPSASVEMSELERMKKELEEAKARIQTLEDEKRRASLTPSRTPTTGHANAIHPPPPVQQQPPPDGKAQAASGPSHRQHHKQQQQQPNQAHPQQQPQPSQQPQQQQPPMQIRNTQSSAAMQQLQNAAHQMQENQPLPNSQQLQSSEYTHFATQAPNPYSLNRSLSSQNMPQNLPSNAAAPHQSPSQPNQMHGGANNTGLGPTPDSANPYDRNFVWSANTYYGYQAAQPHQPDQWNTNRNSGVFR